MASLVLGPILRHVDTESATLWVETDAPCAVEVLGHTAPTFTVCGHHYALVVVHGLTPGVTPYTVSLDGAPAWPRPATPGERTYPPSVIRVPEPDGPVRLAFGSCRYASPQEVPSPGKYGRDCLDAVAERLAEVPVHEWPHLLLLLGDQVYADETSQRTRRLIAERRGQDSEPRGEVADFEEYTWLYAESWADPPVRWLLSTVPSAMIFDDHDVHDDWNTSGSWRDDAARLSWWPERIVGALMSYWVYQHLGNLSPAELEADAAFRAILDGADAEATLRALAVAADREADGAKGYRWSYRRDVGRTRIVVLDSRCGRVLAPPHRLMLGEEEFAWAERQMVLDDGTVDHLVVGTSLPWLLPPALHDVETWNEKVCEHRRALVAGAGEKLRRAADLEHWAAFGDSFERLALALERAAAGDGDGYCPASISVVSGDVHHSYVGEAMLPRRGDTRVYQLTCSPLHNAVPAVMRVAFRVAWNRRVERVVRAVLGRLAKVEPSGVRYRRVAGPFFGNAVAWLDFDGRSAQLRMESTGTPAGNSLAEVVSLRLA